jgi:hypothetical protein
MLEGMISYRHDIGAWLNAAQDHARALASAQPGRAGAGCGDDAVMALEDLWI